MNNEIIELKYDLVVNNYVADFSKTLHIRFYVLLLFKYFLFASRRLVVEKIFRIISHFFFGQNDSMLFYTSLSDELTNYSKFFFFLVLKVFI